MTVETPLVDGNGRAQQPFVLWGAAGHALVLRECLGRSDRRLVAVFDNLATAVSPFDDVPLYVGRAGFGAWLETADPHACGFLVAIGGARGRDRLDVHSLLETSGLRALVAIHRTAFVADGAVIGAGSQVLAQAAVCAGASLGRQVIVNTSASVDHECEVADGVHIGPGAHLAGAVVVASAAFVGAGAVVLPRVRIGEDSIVGAGAVVTRDVPSRAVVAGNPARLLRTLPPAEAS